MKRKGQVRIGISNGVVPGNKTSFPPAFQSKSRLHYYSTLFNTIEVNSCFYKTPRAATFDKWATDVPDDFQFTLKISKEVTHTKDLQTDLACVSSFLSPAGMIGDKKGCLLIQFPGKITLDHFTQVENILEELHEQDTSHQWRKALEFRHESWYTGETAELADHYRAAIVLHDFKKAALQTVMSKAGFIYLRFHGPKGDYRDSYSEQFLQKKASEIRKWTKQGKDVYAYFNNTIGNAFENGLRLKSLTT